MSAKNKSATNKDKARDDFASVAARLGCDPDLKKFDAKLKKIANIKRKRTEKN
jgi:hypothetical protein